MSLTKPYAIASADSAGRHPETELIKRAIRLMPPGSVNTIIYSGAMAAAGAVSGLLAARMLSTSDRGILAVCFVWVALLAQLIDCGVPQAIAYFSATSRTTASSTFGTGISLTVPQALLAMVLVVALREHLIASPSARSLVLIAAVAVPAVLLHSYAVGLFRGLQRYGWMNAVRALPVAIWTLAVLVAFTLGLSDVQGLVIAYIVGIWVSAVVGIGAAVRELAGTQLGFKGVGGLLRYGVLVWVSSVGHQTNARIDQFMLGAMAAAASLGIYAVAVGLATSLSVVSLAMGAVTLPQVAAAQGRARREVIRRNTGMTLAIISVLALIGFVVAPALVSGLLGPRYAPVVPLMRILLVAQIALGGTQVLDEVFRGMGRPGIPAIVEGTGTVITIAVLAAALPRYGATAAAWTSLLVYWLVFVTLALLVRPILGTLDRPMELQLEVEEGSGFGL